MIVNLVVVIIFDNNFLVFDLMNVVGGIGLGEWRKLRVLFWKVKFEVL